MSVRDLTELGAAEAFAEAHADRLRHVAAWDKWLVREPERWAVDSRRRAVHFAAAFVTEQLEVAMRDETAAVAAVARAKSGGDTELVKLQEERVREAHARRSWWLKCHGRSKVGAIVDLARSIPSLAVNYVELDADPWAFNVANGTLDLRTGVLRPHDPTDLVTKLAPVAYDPSATCPTWDAFVEQSLAGDREMMDFLFRAFGYCLTGEIREHVLFFLFGPGGTGKSTTFKIAHALLGDYAVRAARSLLFAGSDRHPTELTDLHGARLVSCNEIQAGTAFDEALVKDLTGGEEIRARRMREDFWTFAPTHKLWLGGNHKPRVKHFDDAMRRRLRLVPYAVRPQAVDKTLFDKLLAELPGILAWAVRGCLVWQRDGLQEPAAVREQTDAYQAESDPFGEFFSLRLVFGAEGRVPRKQVRAAYVEYCEENGGKPRDAKELAEALRARGVEPGNVRHAGRTFDGWRGVRLATDAERAADQTPRRGDVGTVGSVSRLIGDRAFPRGGNNRDLPPTRPHNPTDEDGHCFSDLLDGVAQ